MKYNCIKLQIFEIFYVFLRIQYMSVVFKIIPIFPPHSKSSHVPATPFQIQSLILFILTQIDINLHMQSELHDYTEFLWCCSYVYIYLGLTIGDWITYVGTFSWSRLILPLLAVIMCTFSCMSKPCDISIHIDTVICQLVYFSDIV